jgi:hypothetical protein
MRIDLARHIDVVAKAAGAGNKAQILLATQRLSDAFIHGNARYRGKQSDARIFRSGR